MAEHDQRRLGCPGGHFSITSECTIAVLKAVIPCGIILYTLITHIPVPRRVKKLLHPITDVFQDRASLENIAPPAVQERVERGKHIGPTLPRQATFVGVGLVGSAWWLFSLGLAVVRYVNRARRGTSDGSWEIWTTALISASWMYLLFLPLLRPSRKPRYSALCVYLVHTVLSVVSLASLLYLKTVDRRWPDRATDALFLTRNILSFCLGSIGIIATFGQTVTDDIVLAGCPEVQIDDNVTLFQWITFSWVDNLIRTGYDHDLADNEVPPLSHTMRTKESYETLKSYTSPNLLIRLLRANSLDIVLDMALTLVSVVCNYASPYLIKRIIDAITDPTPEAKAQAYVYAILALLASLGKAQSDIFHLWHGRRCSVRVKNQLIAAIYDKALRRKDASGIIDKDAGKTEVAKGSKKATKAKPEVQKQAADSGRVVSLMASDTARISNVISGMYFIVGGLLELPVASIFLYQLLGYSAFVGFVVMIVASPLTSIFMKRYIAIQQESNKARDKRITVMNELISSIKFIKFFGWTENWKQKALDARNAEMRLWIKNIINGVCFHIVYILGPLAVTLISFTWFILVAKGKLTVSVAFTSLSLFSMIRQPLNTIPQFGVMISQAYVSIKRIDDFCQEDEVADWVSSLKRSARSSAAQGARIAFENADFRWNTGLKKVDPAAKVPTLTDAGPSDPNESNAENTLPFELNDLNIEFPIAKITMIVGNVGSGKSALLNALLGEMECVRGQVITPKEMDQVDPKTMLRNSIAFCSQIPWLQHKTIRENILFGEVFDEERYQMTLDACALIPDLEVLEDGDETEVGVRGVSLSGGQKARIALARAVYSRNAHVLLDDVLAAVDSQTGRHLVDNCLTGPLLRGRTVIIVSHHVEMLLPSVDYVVRMLDGRVESSGTPRDLRQRGLLEGLLVSEATIIEKDESTDQKDSVAAEVRVLAEADHDKDTSAEGNKKARPGRKLVKDEERASGSVKFATYKTYIVASTWTVWTLTVLLLGLVQLTTLGERWWLKLWGSAYEVQKSSLHVAWTSHQALPFISDSTDSQAVQHLFVVGRHNDASNAVAKPWHRNLPSADEHPGFYLMGLFIINMASFAISIFSSLVSSYGTYKASIAIHNRMLDSVMGSTVRFFDTTPSGRIINRFSKDIETLDSSLGSTLKQVLANIATLVGAIAMVASILPAFLLPAAAIGYFFFYLTVRYLNTSRSLRRIEATKRSPIFSGFNEVLDGISIVRAFGVERMFTEKLFKEVDDSQAAYYHLWMCNRWLLYRFDALGATAVFLTTILCLSGAVSAGSAGVAILSSQSLVMGVYWISRFWGSLEQDFNSVERAKEYLDLPQEPPSSIPGKKPPAYWPSDSNKEHFLELRNVSMRYAPDLPDVLRDLSFTIRAKEKIGVVGRTGSGKSTLAMSLLRFVDPSQGQIFLDGIDICSIGVDDLRRNITYIPQEAVLFTGTVRENLDPFHEHSDQELLDVLEKVQISGSSARTPSESKTPSRVPSLANLQDEETSSSMLKVVAPTVRGRITLDTQVSQGGSSLSAGQRQLLALARALLRRSNLILADECSASLDTATDEAIQQTMRTEFADSCVITIAHRISTIIDADRLIVLADGKIVELDTPWNLLNRSDSPGAVFKNMAISSGHFTDLYEAARPPSE